MPLSVLSTKDRATSSDIPLLPVTSVRPVWADQKGADISGLRASRIARMALQQSRLMAPLHIALGLLLIDGAVEMALVSSMVYYLHHDGKGPFHIISSASSTGGHMLFGEPANLIVNQGHTTNGAAGTAVILIGFGGFLALMWERRSRRLNSASSKIFALWAFLTVLSVLLSLGALIYTFDVTHQTSGQSIDPSIAATLSPTTPYPFLSWTPENWYGAVLATQLGADTDRSEISHNYDMMRGWRWNLIPMFLLGLVVAALAVLEARNARNARGRYNKAPIRPEAYSTGYPEQGVTK